MSPSPTPTALSEYLDHLDPPTELLLAPGDEAVFKSLECPAEGPRSPTPTWSRLSDRGGALPGAWRASTPSTAYSPSPSSPSHLRELSPSQRDTSSPCNFFSNHTPPQGFLLQQRCTTTNPGLSDGRHSPGDWSAVDAEVSGIATKRGKKANLDLPSMMSKIRSCLQAENDANADTMERCQKEGRETLRRLTRLNAAQILPPRQQERVRCHGRDVPSETRTAVIGVLRKVFPSQPFQDKEVNVVVSRTGLVPAPEIPLRGSGRRRPENQDDRAFPRVEAVIFGRHSPISSCCQSVVMIFLDVQNGLAVLCTKADCKQPALIFDQVEEVARQQIWARWSRWNTSVLPKQIPPSKPRIAAEVVTDGLADSASSYATDQHMVNESSPMAEIYDELFFEIADEGASAVGTDGYEAGSVSGTVEMDVDLLAGSNSADALEVPLRASTPSAEVLDKEEPEQKQDENVETSWSHVDPPHVPAEDHTEPDQKRGRAGSKVALAHAQQVAAPSEISSAASTEEVKIQVQDNPDGQPWRRQLSPTMEDGFDAIKVMEEMQKVPRRPSFSRPLKQRAVSLESEPERSSSHHINLDNVPERQSPRGSPQKAMQRESPGPAQGGAATAARRRLMSDQSSVERIASFDRSLELVAPGSTGSDAPTSPQIAGSALFAARGLPVGSSETTSGSGLKKTRWRAIPSSHQTELYTRRHGGPFALPSALLLSSDLQSPERRPKTSSPRKTPR